MTLDEQLAAILGSAARLAVLRVFLLDPHRAYYQRQVEQASLLPIRAVQRELERLAEIGLAYRRNEGKRVYYQADPEHPLFDELRALVLKAATPAERLRGALAVLPGLRLAVGAAGLGLLLVAQPGAVLDPSALPAGEVRVAASEEFLSALSAHADWLNAYLVAGEDLLGRREDLVWRRIETAGYTVAKGAGVP
jgi:DNA-binding transcriptional ArsR family regulator